jgi:hypothetical protein
MQPEHATVFQPRTQKTNSDIEVTGIYNRRGSWEFGIVRWMLEWIMDKQVKEQFC